MNLHEIANAPGYGTGRNARDRAAAIAEIKSLLPDPLWMPTFTAEPHINNGLPLASFGNSAEDGQDWHVTHDMGDTSRDAIEFGSDAKLDARIVAAILNAYARGILVMATDSTKESSE